MTDSTRTTAQNAVLSLLLEVASTPKPGNVDREREYEDLRFEHFLTGAIGTLEGFRLAAEGDAIGRAFERAVAGMSHQSGGNTQFGAILLLTPLVAAAGRTELTPEAARAVVTDSTVDDTVDFFRAFDHVDVAVDDPPESMGDLDVRRGSGAESVIREREIPLESLMAASRDVDGLAAEWDSGFPRTFSTADAIEDGTGPITERAATVFLELLASEVDTFVHTQHDETIAREVRRRAQAVLDGDENVDELAEEFVDRGINPGTTADIVAGGLFVALERGVEI